MLCFARLVQISREEHHNGDSAEGVERNAEFVCHVSGRIFPSQPNGLDIFDTFFSGAFCAVLCRSTMSLGCEDLEN